MLTPHTPLPTEPVGRDVMRMWWEQLLFMHFPYEPSEVQALLPDGLTAEPWEDGKVYVGLIPFLMRVGSPGGRPMPKWAGVFCETNVRTYVTGPDGTPGVYFFSLEAGRLPATATARLWVVDDATLPVTDLAHTGLLYRLERDSNSDTDIGDESGGALDTLVGEQLVIAGAEYGPAVQLRIRTEAGGVLVVDGIDECNGYDGTVTIDEDGVVTAADLAVNANECSGPPSSGTIRPGDVLRAVDDGLVIERDEATQSGQTAHDHRVVDVGHHVRAMVGGQVLDLGGGFSELA